MPCGAGIAKNATKDVRMTPLTPTDCDLRDFHFMPLDVVRLRDSDIAAISTGDEFRCAVLLWCASWHQMPAASLPDDDIVLANLAGFGRVVKEWKKVRNAALRGWIKCDDGRLYHPVIAEKANTSWRAKLEQAWRTECARLKKHNQRHEQNPLNVPEFEDWLSQRQIAIVPEDNQELSEGQITGVPAVSLGKLNPIERERDTERDRENINKHTSSKDLDIDKSKTNEPIDPPTDPVQWINYFNAKHGTSYSDRSMHDRRKVWPILTAWISAGIRREQIDRAIIKANEDAKEPISNLIVYVDRVLASMQSARTAPVQWWKTEAGITQKLTELGMKTRSGESTSQLLARMNIEIEKRGDGISRD